MAIYELSRKVDLVFEINWYLIPPLYARLAG